MCFLNFQSVFGTTSTVKVAHIGIGGFKEGQGRPPPPQPPKFFRFHAVFWEILAKSDVGATPGELAPPPGGNPGSTTT